MFVGKVIAVNGTQRVISVKTLNNRVLPVVAVIKNGQPIPNVGDLVVIEDAFDKDSFVNNIPICVGRLEISAPSTDNENISNDFAKPVSDIVQFTREPIAASEGDWSQYNPTFNSFVGFAQNITAIVNDIVGLILDSVENSVNIRAGQVKVETNNYTVRLDDSGNGIGLFSIEGKISGDLLSNNFLFEITPLDANKILTMKIFSGEGDLISLKVNSSGKLTLENKSDVSVKTNSFIISADALSLIANTDISINASNLFGMIGSLMVQVSGYLAISAVGKVTISSSDSVVLSGNNVNIRATGSETGTPLSKAITLESANGSILISTPLVETSAANSSVFITTGFPEALTKNMVATSKGVGIFSQFPGGIVIGGPLPTMFPLNSFVKFNEFAILIGALVAAITTFATAQATVASVPGAQVTALAPAYTALAASMAAVAALVVPCKSIMTATAEP